MHQIKRSPRFWRNRTEEKVLTKKVVFWLFLCCVSSGAWAQNNDSRSAKLPPFLGGGISKPSASSETKPNRAPSSSSAPAVASSDSSNAPRANNRTKPPVLITSSGKPAPPNPTASSKAPAANAGTNAVDDDEVIKVETELVTIPVTVFDRQGRFLPGLRQSDFRITENGKPQQIAYFQTTEQPFTVVLLIDVSNSTKFKINEIQDAAIAFTEQLKPNDRVMVISFDDNVNVLTEPTSDRRRLANAIRQANFGGGTSLYDAVDFAINRRLNQIEGRKAVVLFTDGVDTTSRHATYDGTVRDSEELDATFYPVYFNTYNDMQDRSGGVYYPPRRFPTRRGGWGDIIGVILSGGNVQIGGGGTVGTSRAEYERGRHYLEDLSNKTGGRFYNADSTRNLDAAFSGIAEELRRQYSIGYYPSETGKQGERKQIRVIVNRSDAIVRARDSYIVGEQKPQTRFTKQNLAEK
jgi:Ca-activated chloride channel family protein